MAPQAHPHGGNRQPFSLVSAPFCFTFLSAFLSFEQSSRVVHVSPVSPGWLPLFAYHVLIMLQCAAFLTAYFAFGTTSEPIGSEVSAII